MVRYISITVLALCLCFATFAHAKPQSKARNGQILDFTLILGERHFDPLTDLIAMESKWDDAGQSGDDLRLVQFDGPIQEAWVQSLRDIGVTPIQYIHPYTYITWADPLKRDAALSLPHVRWTGDFVNGYKVLPKWRNLSDQPISTKLMVYKGVEVERVVEQLADLGAIRIERSTLDDRFEVLSVIAPGSLYIDFSTIQGVYTVQPVSTDGGLRSEMSNQVNAGNVDSSNMAFPGYADWLEEIDLTGRDVIIAIVDGGSDEAHVDLSGQFVTCAGQSCNGGGSSSHGTHCAGTVGATGISESTDSDGFLQGQGVAPGVSLLNQVYSPMYQQPGGMTQLMIDSRQNGAIASSNSWGPSGSPLGYDIDTLETDIAVRDADPDTIGNQGFTYVLAIMNGNGGTSSQGTPDEAKNIFTVGSTKMRNSSGSQYAEINDISSNSAHGPCLDGRIIPHIVAPGCRTLSTTLGSSYSLMCGTSMACPQVAGGVALFVEQYRDAYEADPSPALIKAAFTAAATDLSGNDDADGGTLGHPFDSKQGWGRMDLNAVLDNPVDSVRYYDAPVVLEQTGDQWEVTVSPLDPMKPMKIMLVWTDAVGHGLGGSSPAWNNDLDLTVSTGLATYRGNNIGSQGWTTPGGTADNKNNTEGVFLGPTSPGQVTITVTAANLNSDGIPNMGDAIDQDFSLVCYNAAAQPGFSVSIAPSSQSVCAPESAEYTVHVGQIMGYSEQITLLSEMETGLTATFSQNPVSPGTDVTMTVSVDGSVGDASYMFHVRGTSADQSYHEAAATIHVSGAIPQEVTLIQPQHGTTDVSLSPSFMWMSNNSALAWHIQVATTADETDIIHENESVDATMYQVPFTLNSNAPYFWRVRALNNCGVSDWTSWWTFRTTDALAILLVDDDDNSPDVRTMYTDMLDSAGVLYEIYDTNNSNNEPSLSEMQGYPLVIWFTGAEYGGFAGPGSEGESALASYIDAGGRLLLSSQDYLWDNELTSFGQNYLGIGSYTDDVYQSSVSGEAIFSSLGSVSLTYPSFSNYSDEVNPAADAMLAFGGSVGNAGILFEGTGHAGAAIFLAFPIEAMPLESQEQLMNEVVEWVGVEELPCDADCSGDGTVDVSDLLAVIAAWGTSSGCDTNEDGIVDIGDLLSVVGAWGSCP